LLWLLSVKGDKARIVVVEHDREGIWEEGENESWNFVLLCHLWAEGIFSQELEGTKFGVECRIDTVSEWQAHISEGPPQ
jgi:hypothetical protein